MLRKRRKPTGRQLRLQACGVRRATARGSLQDLSLESTSQTDKQRRKINMKPEARRNTLPMPASRKRKMVEETSVERGIPRTPKTKKAANHRIKERNGCGPNHHVKRMALRTILEHVYAHVAAQVDPSSEKADSLDRKETFHPCFTSRLVSLRTSQAISAASVLC